VELGVAVNLSARNLVDPATIRFLLRKVEDEGVPPGALELEITESAVMVDPERTIRALRDLRERGLRLAIDDFGTGFSSFAYLRDLPVDKLKIDRSFVARMLESEKDAAIVRATIDLGHTLGLLVAAEGVEDRVTFDVLAGLGCDVVQGYFVAKPMPGDEFVRWSASSGWRLRAQREARQA
jgi:EAL domain-containing protein (putative c-di-GMP-specific phosphodiesterase class I)